jgi:hypothetical protein
VFTNQTTAQRSYVNTTGVFSIVKVVNTSSNTVTVIWNDKHFDEIEIYNENDEIFLPTIPVLNTQQINLNDLLDGVYFINFKEHGTVLKTEVIRIMNHKVVTNST